MSIKDAATILVIRGERPFEVFMVRRGRTAQFMANAMVFPGGRLDDADLDDALLDVCEYSRDEAAAQMGMEDGRHALGLLVAGVRETFEEAGLLLATRDGATVDPTSAALRAHRDALNARETSMLAVAQDCGLTLQLSALTYVSRWVTPPVEPRRYDTRFFAVRAPDAQEGAHDAIETTASAWLTAAAALAGYEAGEIDLAPPTYRILEALAECSATDVLATAHAPLAIHPQAVTSEGEFVLALPGDPAYDPPGEARNRFTLRDGRWWSEGSGY